MRGGAGRTRTAGHNGLVAGSSPTSSTTHSLASGESRLPIDPTIKVSWTAPRSKRPDHVFGAHRSEVCPVHSIPAGPLPRLQPVTHRASCVLPGLDPLALHNRGQGILSAVLLGQFKAENQPRDLAHVGSLDFLI